MAQLLDTAVAHHQRDELAEAEKLYLAFLARAPGNPHGWTNLGALRRKQGHYDAAIAAHLRALEIEPGMSNALNNLANAYNDAGDYPAAIPIREAFLAKTPDDLVCIRDLAVCLRGDLQHKRVISLVDAAEERQDLSDHGDLVLQRALSHLMLGNYKAGFRDFEGRYGGNEVSLPEDMPFPRWTGEDIRGKQLLVVPEQGFGDAILMSRFLPRLIDMGATVTMIVKPPLQRLFDNLGAAFDGSLRLVSHAKKSDPFDYYTPNMSLPFLVGMEDDGSPPPAPRIEIPEPARKRARSLVSPFDDRFKIGVVWTGSLSYKANHRRSCGPAAFLPISAIP
ncbi:MAG: tetratricopeptide repeat protein, partial [Pseudomonadota bacterium]